MKKILVLIIAATLFSFVAHAEKVGDKWVVTENKEISREYTWEGVESTIAQAEANEARAKDVAKAYKQIKADMKAAGMDPADAPKESIGE